MTEGQVERSRGAAGRCVAGRSSAIMRLRRDRAERRRRRRALGRSVRVRCSPLMLPVAPLVPTPSATIAVGTSRLDARYLITELVALVA